MPPGVQSPDFEPLSVELEPLSVELEPLSAALELFSVDFSEALSVFFPSAAWLSPSLPSFFFPPRP